MAIRVWTGPPVAAPARRTPWCSELEKPQVRDFQTGPLIENLSEKHGADPHCGNCDHTVDCRQTAKRCKSAGFDASKPRAWSPPRVGWRYLPAQSPGWLSSAWHSDQRPGSGGYNAPEKITDHGQGAAAA